VKLRGRVIDAADGSPIPEAEVTILSERRTTNTRRDGRFEVHGLPPGEHTVFVHASGYGGAKLGPIDVEGGAEVPELEGKLERANVRLRGHVRAGRSAPLETSVLLIPEGGDDATVYESTKKRSEFVVDGLPPGPYALIVAALLKGGGVEIERRKLS